MQIQAAADLNIRELEIVLQALQREANAATSYVRSA